MKRKLLCLVAFLPVLGFGQIFSENFEQGTFPPDGWTVQQTNENETWAQADGLMDSQYAASVLYDDALGLQDEWLISPSIDLSSHTSLYLNFTAALSYGYSISPYNNYDVFVKISTDGGTTWSSIWSENDLGVFGEYTENHVTINLSAAINATDVKIAFQYLGTDGGQLLIDNVSVTEEVPAPIFPAPYCVIVGIDYVEAISYVEFAGIQNGTDPTEDVNAHEDFTAMTANVNIGESYPLALEGNTAGDYEDFFTVYIDWNQNQNYTDEGETYEIGSITNSDGTDGQQATAEITVPATALEGTTRMRVFKNYELYTPGPCDTEEPFGGFGQAEEYTVTVGPALATTTFDSAKFAYYPNPVKNVLNLSYKQNISDVKIFNILGQEVLTKSVNAAQGQVDMSNLPSGNYIAKITSNNVVKTIKVVKE